MKRDSVSDFVHMRRDTPLPLYVPVHILDDPSSIPPAAWVLNRWPISQPQKKNIRISYSLKYKHSTKKIICEKINGSAG